MNQAMKLALATVTTIASLSSWAQSTPTAATPQSVTITGATAPPLADYAKPPEYQQPILSPNGQHLAVLMPIKGRINLAVIDLGKMSSKILTGIDRFDVLDVRWVGNDRLVFNLGERNTPTGPGTFEGGGLFMVSRDGTESRVLTPTIRELRASGGRRYPNTQPLSPVEGNDKEILVSEYGRTADGLDVYTLDITTGKRTLVTVDRPKEVSRYVLDLKRVPRVAISGEKDTDRQFVWYRDDEKSPWVQIAKGEGFATQGFMDIISPVAFDSDNKNLIVQSSQGRDTEALFRYNVAERKLGELLVGHPRFDVLSETRRSQVKFNGQTRELAGIELSADRAENVWFDEESAKLQATIDRALPGRVNRISRATGKAVITSYSDTISPTYYLFDEAARKLEPLVAAMPWIKPGHFVEMRPFTLKTRDGLEIPSYYFLPKTHKAGDKLPTVLHIHGGPHARADHWGPGGLAGYGVAEAQALASRGYAVVLPNHRITPELGRKIYMAGKHSVGRQMSEDHEDAAKWAVDQGFADPKRLCITGGSYGGYATLRALAKTPDLFKCGIAGLSVSDMELQLRSTAGDTVDSTVGVAYWSKFIIGEDAKPGTARAISPVHQAAQIKSPLMLYAGAADIRTPIEQTNRMVSALKAAGHNPEVLIKTEEGHGFGVLANRVELWEKMVAFLDKHIGGAAVK